MKKYILSLCFFPYATPAAAQSTEEWLRQKETALRYAVEQLAALRSQSAVLKKGYALVADGLQAIAAIKEGDHTLHALFQSTLRKLNPAYQRAVPKLQAQYTWLKQEIGRTTLELTRATANLTGAEISYLKRVLRRLEQQVAEGTKHLDALGTPGSLTLTDAERAGRIQALAQMAKSDIAFLLSFKKETAQLLAQRRVEQATIFYFQKIGGL